MHPVSVIVDDLRSAYNVGSVFRTADAAGFQAVYLTGFSATPDHREVRKTALGAEASVPWSYEGDVLALVARLRAEGHIIAALERTERSVPPEAVEARHFPLALVLGNEVSGVKPTVLDAADLVIGLPLYGKKTSLNVAVAFGVAAYGLVARYRALASGR